MRHVARLLFLLILVLGVGVPAATVALADDPAPSSVAPSAATAVNAVPDDFQPPRVIPESRVPLALPAHAKIGDGVLRFTAMVRKDGSVANVRAADGAQMDAAVERAAASAIGRWRYEPARQGSSTVDSSVEVTVRLRAPAPMPGGLNSSPMLAMPGLSAKGGLPLPPSGGGQAPASVGPKPTKVEAPGCEYSQGGKCIYQTQAGMGNPHLVGMPQAPASMGAR